MAVLLIIIKNKGVVDMSNLKVTKGQFKTVEDFLQWEQDNDNMKGVSPLEAHVIIDTKIATQGGD